MYAELKEYNDSGARIEVFIPFTKSMLESEEIIQQAANEVGSIATGEVLKCFDSDGSPIKVGGTVLYSKKDKVAKCYETPYGAVEVSRFVYQSSKGGATFCPLDQNARIISSATPRFAKIVSYKYAAIGADEVCSDLEMSNGRKVAKSFVQNISEKVGNIALLKEEYWSYHTPNLGEQVSSISIGLDGTSVYMREDGYRQAMVGTISLYDKEGERLHTTYMAERPEYGKEPFINRFENEIEIVKGVYPQTKRVGLADGAKDNWIFLKKHTEVQTIDFYHVSEYVATAAEVMFKKKEREEWTFISCSEIKHEEDGADKVLCQIIEFKANNPRLSKAKTKKIDSTITYFENNIDMMNYRQNLGNNLPIGSGVTEAGCKVIVKQRLCCSGMRWKDRGATIVLSLRCMRKTEGRWDQFWSKIDRYGFLNVA